mgnify:FL=1
MAVLLAARHLIDRTRHPRGRADALLQLRTRLEKLPSTRGVAPERVSLARRLGELRQQLTDALRDVRSCAGCALGHPEPYGHWSGGHCCGGETPRVFTDDELAVLKLSGTTSSKLTPPRSDFAGCAFRGPVGCSLEPGDRPPLCVRFVCMELERELRQRGDLPKIRALQRELSETFARLTRRDV